MTDNSQDLRAANTALARAWMTTLNEPAWWNLMDEDVVLEFPYGPSIGVPERIVGRPAVVEYCKALFARLGVMKFQNLEVNGTTDPNVFFNEYYANLSTPKGEVYKQVYVNKLRFNNGKLVLMREYWDPKRIVDASKDSLNLG